jgi:hypothetical protein
MKKLLALLTFVVAVGLGADASAKCDVLSVFSAEDISGGSATSGVIKTDLSRQATLQINLTDADDGISDLTFSFKERNHAADTLRKVGFGCLYAQPKYTCKQGQLAYNPKTAEEGDDFSMPLPFNYKFIEVAVTVTGAAAADVLNVTLLACE